MDHSQIVRLFANCVACYLLEMENEPDSHVNRIPGVRLDKDGVVHTEYGSYNPVTGVGLPIPAPKELLDKIELALIRDGEESGLVEDFDWDRFMEEMFPDA